MGTAAFKKLDPTRKGGNCDALQLEVTGHHASHSLLQLHGPYQVHTTSSSVPSAVLFGVGFENYW